MKQMVGMVVLSLVTKMKTAKFTDITPSFVRFIFFYLAEMQSHKIDRLEKHSSKFRFFYDPN